MVLHRITGKRLVDDTKLYEKLKQWVKQEDIALYHATQKAVRNNLQLIPVNKDVKSRTKVKAQSKESVSSLNSRSKSMQRSHYLDIPSAVGSYHLRGPWLKAWNMVLKDSGLTSSTAAMRAGIHYNTMKSW